MLRRAAARSEAARALAMFAGGALVALVLALALGQRGMVQGPPALAWGWVLGALALGAAFLASNLALQYGAARLPANTTAVVMLSEVLFASVSAVALGAGALDARVLAGGALIVAAALSAARQRSPGDSGVDVHRDRP
jgi:drug/metabolite transporter (DMT)-like permease